MKILQLCPRVPFPPVDGGTYGMHCMSKAMLKQGAGIKVLAFNTSKHFVEPEKIKDEYLNPHHLETVFLNNHPTFFSALNNLFFSNESYHISRFISTDFENALMRILKEEHFDIVILEQTVMCIYIDIIRKNSKAKIVLRAHNVEHRIWKRLANSASNPFKKFYLNILAKRMRKFEMNTINKVDAIVTLTEEETKLFKAMGATKPMHVSPICFFLDEFKPDDEPKEFSLFHIGAMDWMPNITGMKWFLKEVWSKINVTHPQIKLYLAGNKMPKDFFSFNSDNCNVQGRVEDARKFMAAHSVMIVPLLAGSGIRVKIVEGMAMGKPIISTSQGAEGLHYENRKNILIANTLQEFYNAIIDCYKSPGLRKSLGENARKLAMEYYDMNKVGEEVFEFYQSLI